MNDESRLIFISKDQTRVKEVKISRARLIGSISLFLVLFLVAGKFGLDYLVDFSYDSTIKRLERTNNVLQSRLSDMQTQIKGMNSEMSKIAKEDDRLRLALGLNELDSDVRQVGIGGAKYDYANSDEVSGFDGPVSLSEQLSAVDKLEREVKLEYESYRDLIATFQKKQDSLAYLPALRPIITGYVSSSFGRRLHPILRVYRHHEGIDISAKRGTPVYATANGTVTFAKKNGGYGNMIMLDHKYGFQTRYGHLNKILVRHGQYVKRGEKIGEVGNTGLSTAPHLHYEVRFKGKPVNPSSYYFDEIGLNKEVISRQ